MDDCNGLVAAEYFWQAFNPGNASIKASLSGGTSYAIGGSTTGTENFIEVWNLTPDPLRPNYQRLGNAWQLGEFAASAPTFNPVTSLFLVWLFPNDVFYYGSSGLEGIGHFDGTTPADRPISTAELIVNGVTNLVGSIQTLASQGARNSLVVNSADLGLIPENLGTNRQAKLPLLSSTFNDSLSNQNTDLQANATHLNLD